MQTDPAPVVESKFFLRSKTILFALLMALPQILGAFDIRFTDADVQLWTERLTTVFGLIGIVWGRRTASGGISFRIAPRISAAAIFLGFFAAIAALYLSACGSLPRLKARACYTTAGGQRVCVGTDGKAVTVDADITSRPAGDGKATIEFGTR